MPEPVLFENVIASVSAAETRAPTMPNPAWAVGLLTITASAVTSPATVKVCSAVVLAATMDGESVAVKPRSATFWVRGLEDRLTPLRKGMVQKFLSMMVERFAPKLVLWAD